MAQITFKGTTINTSGSLPAKGTQAPGFALVAADLSEKTLQDFSGKKKVLSINPSYDTGVCQSTARSFNQRLGERGDVAVLLISSDLPFAQKRFCDAEGLGHVMPLSSFRSSFSTDYGIQMVDGPLKGLVGRAVLVLDEDNIVVASQLVPEIVQEPDYESIIAALH